VSCDVALDLRSSRRMSVGVRNYRDALVAGLPRVAPDLRIAAFTDGGDYLTLAEQRRLPRIVRRLRPRLTHYVNVYAPLAAPRPYVVTVHDLTQVRHPELFGVAHRVWHATVGRAILRGAARLVMGDERTAEDLERFFGIPRDRTRVVPLGYDPRLLAIGPREAVGRPYFFYAGNHRAHKDLPTFFAAWASLPEELAVDCIVTGSDESGFGRRFARRNGTLQFLGDLDEATLWRRYRDAAAYVQPAVREGFGIPMLEAAVVGTPVVATIDAAPGILSDVAARFPVGDVRALRALLTETLCTPDALKRRAAEGVARAIPYTWDRFAASTAAVYRELL
jgi:glycosyltransferase involved in cell wall biosynthesis